MKKIMFTICAVLVGFFASAQQSSLGIKGGLNLATIKEKGVSDAYKSQPSIHLGILVDAPITEKFSIQPEVVYSPHTMKLDVTGSLLLKLSYMTLPVVAKYNVAGGLNVEVGPQVGFLLSANGMYMDKRTDVSHLFTSGDFGMNFGLSYRDSRNFFIQLRYYIGMSNISKVEIEGTNAPAAHNRVFQLSIGHYFK